MGTGGMRRAPKVVVVGGSLAGLNAALYLRDIGWDVEVFERSANDLQGRGAGIVVQPATIWYFVESGQVDLPEISTVSHRLRYLNPDGSVRYEEQRTHRFTSWNALYANYRAALGDDRYHLDCAVVDFATDERGVTVVFADGIERRADLLVGADGPGSTLRARLLPDVRPSYGGYVGWRGVLDDGDLPEKARTEFFDALVYHQMREGQILGYPIPASGERDGGGSQALNWIWYRNVAEGSELEKLLTDADGRQRTTSLPPGTVPRNTAAELREVAAACHPPVFAELVEATAEPFLQVISDLAVPRMAFDRVCLLGDSAFTLRPHAAVGTAKAAVDAWCLAQELARSGMDIPAALEEWQARQLDLGRRLLQRNQRMGDRSQFERTWEPEDTSLRFGM